MRTRYIKLLHYGITKEEKKVLLQQAKLEENAPLLHIAVDESNKGLSDLLFLSLTTGKGYMTISKEGYYIPTGADDFYAYQRRALYIFKLLLKGKEALQKNHKISQIY